MDILFTRTVTNTCMTTNELVKRTTGPSFVNQSHDMTFQTSKTTPKFVNFHLHIMIQTRIQTFSTSFFFKKNAFSFLFFKNAFTHTVYPKSVFGIQCKPWSSPAECGIWSGPSLLAESQFLKSTQSGTLNWTWFIMSSNTRPYFHWKKYINTSAVECCRNFIETKLSQTVCLTIIRLKMTPALANSVDPYLMAFEAIRSGSTLSYSLWIEWIQYIK